MKKSIIFMHLLLIMLIAGFIIPSASTHVEASSISSKTKKAKKLYKKKLKKIPEYKSNGFGVLGLMMVMTEIPIPYTAYEWGKMIYNLNSSSDEQYDRILFTYFGRKPSLKEQRHYYAYIAISGFFYMHWTMYKESQGQEIGYLKPLWYHFAKEFSKKTLPLYNE